MIFLRLKMLVNKFFIKIIILLCLSLNLFAVNIGSIGAASPNYPPLGETVHRPSPATVAFLNDLMHVITDSNGDAAVAVQNSLNIPYGAVKHKDIYYKDHVLLTGEKNEEVIREFYSHKDIRFLAEIAKNNKVDVIMRSFFHPSSFKRVFNKRTKQAITKLTITLQIYDYQTNGKSQEHVTIEVEDLFGYPDVNPHKLKTKLESAYTKLFNNVFNQLQHVGGNDFSTSGESSKEEQNEDVVSDIPKAKSGGDDW